MSRLSYYLASALVACKIAQAGIVPEDATLLSKSQLIELLGSKKASPLTWKKISGFDYKVYYGTGINEATVGIYVGGFPPFQRDTSLPQIPGQLGLYTVTWQKKERADMLLMETTTALHSDNLKAQIWVIAKKQGELDFLIQEVSKLPMFNKLPEPVRTP